MKIAVFSDSHKRIDLMEQVLDKLSKSISAVIHLGDCFGDTKRLESVYKNITFYTVYGNCDTSFNEACEDEIEIGGKRIFITHGNDYSVKSTNSRLISAAIEKQASACLFGHTHIPAVFYESNITFMNPGSIGLPKLLKRPTFGTLEITSEGNIIPTVIQVERNGEFTIIL